MFLGKTKDTWKKELVELFFFCLWGTSIAAVVAILVYGISFATGKSLQQALEFFVAVALVPLAGQSIWYFCLGCVKRRASLLDLGRTPGLVLASLAFAAGAAILMIAQPHLALIFFGQFVIMLMSAFERLLIVEDGIWQRGSLLKWQCIESYEWKDDSTLILKSQSKRRLLGFPHEIQHSLSIPAGQREAVSQLLEQYACKQTAPS